MVTRAKTLPSTISAAEFKAKCLELMDTVDKTGTSITVTKRGRPVAILGPVRTTHRPSAGFAKATLRIVGDIVGPIDVEWDAAK